MSICQLQKMLTWENVKMTVFVVSNWKYWISIVWSVSFPWNTHGKVCNPCPLGSGLLLGWIWNGLVASSQWAGGTAKSLQGFQGVRETQCISCSTISIWVSSGNEILCSRLHRSRLGLLLAFTGGGCRNISGFGLLLSSWLVLSNTHNGCSIELCLLRVQKECFWLHVILKAAWASYQV